MVRTVNLQTRMKMQLPKINKILIKTCCKSFITTQAIWFRSAVP